MELPTVVTLADSVVFSAMDYEDLADFIAEQCWRHWPSRPILGYDQRDFDRCSLTIGRIERFITLLNLGLPKGKREALIEDVCVRAKVAWNREVARQAQLAHTRIYEIMAKVHGKTDLTVTQSRIRQAANEVVPRGLRTEVIQQLCVFHKRGLKRAAI